MAGGAQANPYSSGLGRFGSIGTYQPTPYTPRNYQPQALPAARPFQPAGGIPGNTASGDQGPGPGGSVGTVGATGQNADGSPNGSPTVGTVGQLGQLGLALGLSGVPGLLGQAVSMGQAANSVNTTPASDDGTTQGISDAIGLMGAADDGTTDGINGAIGNDADGGGGAGGGGK